MDDVEEDIEDEEVLNIDQREVFDDIFENLADISCEPLINLNESFAKMKRLRDELNHLRADNSFDRLKKMYMEEDIIYELDVLERNCTYLQVYIIS